MARREPRVSCINCLKKSTYQKISFFGLIQTVERERESNRERKSIFSLRFTGFRRSDLVRSRTKADLRNEGYTWVPESQDSAKVQGLDFHGNQDKVVSHEITSFEVGFSPSRVNLCLRACVCPRRCCLVFFLRPHDCILVITW